MVVLGFVLVAQIVWIASAPPGLKDLGSFLHSGAAHHLHLNPYAYYPSVQPQPIDPDALNLNPPISVYLFDALSRMDTEAVRLAFFGGSLALFALAVVLLFRAYPQRRGPLVLLAVVCLAGLWHMLWYLQIYAPLLMAVTVGWLLIRRDNLVGAGILIGLVAAIKPNYAVVPLLMLLAGHRRLALPALATAAGISAIPLFLDGPRIYSDWLALTRTFTGLTWASNASLVSVGARYGAEPAGLAAAGALLAGVIYWQWRFRPTPFDSLAAALMTAVLLGPVSWAGYTMLLLPYLFSRPWDRRVWVSVALLDKPYSVEGVSLIFGLFAGSGISPGGAGVSVPGLAVVAPLVSSAYCWAVLLLLGGLMRDVARAHAPEASPVQPQPAAVAAPSRPALAPEPALSPAAD